MYLIIILVVTGCGGSLSREERKELREASERQEIRRVTEAEITEAVLSRGRKITDQAMSLEYSIRALDSLGRSLNVSLRWITPGSSGALAVEQQIIDAYIMSSMDEDLPDNVQKLGEDSLLYTRPVVENLSDGSVRVDGMWSVVFSKKDVILGIGHLQ